MKGELIFLLIYIGPYQARKEVVIMLNLKPEIVNDIITEYRVMWCRNEGDESNIDDIGFISSAGIAAVHSAQRKSGCTFTQRNPAWGYNEEMAAKDIVVTAMNAANQVLYLERTIGKTADIRDQLFKCIQGLGTDEFTNSLGKLNQMLVAVKDNAATVTISCRHHQYSVDDTVNLANDILDAYVRTKQAKKDKEYLDSILDDYINAMLQQIQESDRILRRFK